MPSPLVRVNRARRTSETKSAAISDLFTFGCETLKLDLLSEEYHRPICAWLRAHSGSKRRAYYAPRFSYKSTLLKAEVIEELLANPELEIAIISHSLDLAVDLVVQIGEELLRNEEIRKLLGKHAPPRQGKWLRETGWFVLPGIGRKSPPSVWAGSVGQDLTGKHPNMVYLDDIVSAKSVEELGGVEAIDRWVEHTLIPILGVGGICRVTGTLWSERCFYQQTQNDTGWACVTRGLLETDGKPDPLGEPIKLLVRDLPGAKPRFIDMDDVVRYRDQMKSSFNPQMLNLPQPPGGKPWTPEKSEQYVKFEDIKDYLRTVIILSDPAPKGFGKADVKLNFEREHDNWAISVVGYYEDPQARGILKRTLIDGVYSRNWTLEDGCLQILRLLRKYDSLGSYVVGIEEALGAGKTSEFFCEKIREICRGRHRVQAVPFKSTQRGKKPRLADLFSLAENGAFTLSDSCDPEFLRRFVSECRAYPETVDGHDDLRDCVAYLDDPALHEYIPKASIVVRRKNRSTWWMSEDEDEESAPRMTKYFGF